MAESLIFDTHDLGGAERAAKLTGLDSATDYAGEASDLANKKAKLAHEAHEQSEVEVDETSRSARQLKANIASKQTSLGKAWAASQHKFFGGATTFAGFASLLTGITMAFKVIGAALSAETAMTMGSFVTDLFLPGVGAVGIASLTGALWLGGGEFKRKYQHFSKEAEKDTRLGRVFDGLDRGLDKAKEAMKSRGKDRDIHADDDKQREGELGIVAGSISSHVGAAAMLNDSAMMHAPARTSEAIQAILQAGPQTANTALAARNTALSAVERLEAQAAEMQASDRLSV